MTKKLIFTCLSVALVAFIGYGLYKANALTSVQIVKSITVKGSKEDVFNMVRYFKNFPKWSPFLAQDPTQKYEVKGIDGTVGAQYHWEGNKGNDVGYQEILRLDTFSLVEMKCVIQKPFVAQPLFNYSFEETSNGIEVKQDFKLQSNLKDAFFMWLFDVKSAMENTNQQGLDLLKKAVEH